MKTFRHFINEEISQNNSINEAAPSVAGFKYIEEMLKISSSSTWSNEHHPGIHINFKNKIIETTKITTFLELKLKELSNKAYNWLKKEVEKNFAPKEIEYIFEEKDPIFWSVSIINDKIVIELFNGERTQKSMNLFETSSNAFITAAKKAGYSVNPSKDLQYNFKGLRTVKKGDKEYIIIDINHDWIDKEGGIKNEEFNNNELAITISKYKTNITTNFIHTYNRDSPQKSIEIVTNYLKDILKGFKSRNFKSLINETFPEIYDNYDDKNVLKSCSDWLKNEMPRDTFIETEGNYITLSVKRWKELNWFFDCDNAVAADWTIERTLDSKSEKFLDKLVQNAEKKFKNVEVKWYPEEKWYVTIIVRKK